MTTSVLCIAAGEVHAAGIVSRLKAGGLPERSISAIVPRSHGPGRPRPQCDSRGAWGGGRQRAAAATDWLTGLGDLAMRGGGPFIAAGPIIAALGGAAGAGARGVIRTLIRMGVPELEASRYEARAERGSVLISIQSEQPDEVRRAREILAEQGAEDITTVSDKPPPVVTTCAARVSGVRSEVEPDSSWL